MNDVVSLKNSLDLIDEKVKAEAFDGFYQSRLAIEWGMWEKGEKVCEFRGVNSQTSFYQLEKDTGRNHESLKKWNDLYQKYPDPERYRPIAEEKSKIWTERAFRGQLLRPTEAILLPQGQFRVVYADPPWQYDNSGFNESASNQYPTMPLKDICEITLPQLANEQTVLFLWATNPLLKEALTVMDAWQFEYKTNMAWIKDKGRGKGWFGRSKHELILIGVKPNTPHPEVRPDSCFEAPREMPHSRKPSYVYELIEEMYPGPKDGTFYIELFQRGEARNGWTIWGHEAGKVI